MCVHGEFTFDALFRAHYARLCGFARRFVGCPDTAEDVVQEVFLHVWTLRDEGETFVNPKRYLYAAVRNRALNHIDHERIASRSRGMMQIGARAPAMSAPRAAPDEELEAAELEEALDIAVERLPERCREAYAHRHGGKTRAEIAAVMGTSPRTAETQVTRARRFLRRELAPFLEPSA